MDIITGHNLHQKITILQKILTLCHQSYREITEIAKSLGYEWKGYETTEKMWEIIKELERKKYRRN